jgi:hypothetical protein
MGESENKQLLNKCINIILRQIKWSLIPKY